MGLVLLPRTVEVQVCHFLDSRSLVLKLLGANGIQMKWPVHPGEYGPRGADLHRKWKESILFVKN